MPERSRTTPKTNLQDTQRTLNGRYLQPLLTHQILVKAGVSSPSETARVSSGAEYGRVLFSPELRPALPAADFPEGGRGVTICGGKNRKEPRVAETGTPSRYGGEVAMTLRPLFQVG